MWYYNSVTTVVKGVSYAGRNEMVFPVIQLRSLDCPHWEGNTIQNGAQVGDEMWERDGGT